MSFLNRTGYLGLDGMTIFGLLCLLSALHLLNIVSCLLLVSATVSVRLVRKYLEDKRVESKGKFVLITGCDTGIGFALARLIDRRGFHVFATCLCDSSDGATELRNTSSSRLCVLQLDVTSDESVSKCLEKVAGICGDVGLWALVNNAGTSLGGEVEVQPMALIKHYAEINLFGVVRTTKTFLPLVRKQKGRVVNVTSVRGRLAFPTAGAYCMSKFGAEAFSESLRLEMKNFGVKVITVGPGMYGLEVGQYNDKNRLIMKSKYEEMISSVDEEVMTAYGRENLESFVRDLPRAYPFSEDKLRGVLNVLESAVTSVHPRSRYLADSSNTFIDLHCLLCRLRDVLPEYAMDKIFLWLNPTPKYSASQR